MSWDSDVVTLTDLTESDEFKELVGGIDKPPIFADEVVATPPRDYQGMEYALIGMAVDYLLRFEIQRRNPNASIYVGDLIAEQAVRFDDKMNSDIPGILAGAKASCIAYVNGLDEVPTQAVLDLARLENIVRSGESVIESIDKYLGRGDDDLEEDLENLIRIADDILSVEECAVLNPVLANAGIVADADIVLDGALIDMKTTINPKFSSEFWRQLIGYLVLMDIQSERGGVTNGWSIEKPNEFGVYFSRSGDLKLLSTEPIYTHEDYNKLKEFMERML